MKKVLIIITAIAGLSSCKKEIGPGLVSNSLPKNALPLTNKEAQNLVASKLPSFVLKKLALAKDKQGKADYVAELSNFCYPEGVGVTGAQWVSDNSFTRSGVRYNVYEIKYNNLMGIGHISGRIYKGKDHLSNVTQMFQDGSAVLVIENVAKFGTQEGDSIIDENHSRFYVSPDGQVSVIYNDVIHECR